ncbi:hypothetical protein [Micromonospora sp. SH-82]|uniref:hypothetical protein n=1 Tax=Micromonospora sp. SH-82 TaxID=3132938 RepID=UPI003EBB362C
MEGSTNEILGPLLVAMTTADARYPRLAIELVSFYDERYLVEVVAPALGRSVAPLTTTGCRSLGGWLMRNRPEAPTSPNMVRCRLQVGKPDRWRYEDLSEKGAVVRAHGSDGVTRWAYVDATVRAWRPDPSADVRQLAPTAWQQAPSLALREVIDPSLVLSALSIKHAEPFESEFGAAVRLHGSPRSADLVESALVSPWADRCDVDVHFATGIVLAANNMSASGRALVQHSLVTLDTSSQFGDETFAVPDHRSFVS